MHNINELFFSLIRVAVGTQEVLPHAPSKEEWMELYAMAKKQSLVGIAFAGLQKLSLTPNPLTFVEPRLHSEVREQALTPLVCTSLPTMRGEYLSEASEELEPCEVMAKYWNMPEMLYLKWMGMAAKIQQKNLIVNHHCAEMHKKMTADGLRSCILKGQGVASLYKVRGEGLEVRDISMLRQSGDIDVWVQNRSIEELVEYVKGFGIRYKATAAHVECKPFEDTEVELHAVPAFMRCFWHDKRLKAWFNKNANLTTLTSNPNINVPTNEFNLVYMMVHMYHHVLFEGLGLRQIMDYYFVLRSSQVRGERLLDEPSVTSAEREVRETLRSLGLMKFAEGMVWVIEYVFNNNSNLSPLTSNLKIEPNEKVGRLLLDEIMQGGNFGHHDEKNKGLHGGTAISRSMNGLRRNMKFFALGPWEIMSTPLWSTWHSVWRKRHGFK